MLATKNPFCCPPFSSIPDSLANQNLPPGFSKLKSAIPKKQRLWRIHSDGGTGSSNIQIPGMPLAVVPTPVCSEQCWEWQLGSLGLGCDSSCISAALHLLLILFLLLFLLPVFFLDLALQPSQAFCDFPISFLFKSSHTVNYSD